MEPHDRIELSSLDYKTRVIAIILKGRSKFNKVITLVYCTLRGFLYLDLGHDSEYLNIGIRPIV